MWFWPSSVSPPDLGSEFQPSVHEDTRKGPASALPRGGTEGWQKGLDTFFLSVLA